MINKKDESFQVDRKYQDFFCACLEQMGFDSYGILDRNSDRYNFVKENKYNSWYEDNKFSIASYYWGLYENQSKEEEIEFLRPNFVYKPKNIIINWYKYPLRDAVSNININEKILYEIFSDLFEEFNIKKKKINKLFAMFID